VNKPCPIPLNLATAKGFSQPIPLPQDCADIDVTPTVDGRVFKVRYSRPAQSRACCSDPVSEPVPRFDFVNQPPVVIAGSYAPIYIPNGEFDFVVFNPTVTDDGLPNGTVTFAWSVDSGPGAVVFDDPTNPTTAAHFSVPGTYVLRLVASDGDKEGFGTTTITVIHNDVPVVDAGEDQTITLDGDSVYFESPDATLTDDEIPEPAVVTWSKVSGPADVIFDDVNTLRTGMHFTATGTYVLQLDARDSIGDATPSQVTITVNPGEVPTHTVTLTTHGAGAHVVSSPSGWDFDDTRGSGDETYTHDWDEGTSITITFTNNGSVAFEGFKINGVFSNGSLVTVTPPDGEGFGGAYSYTFTLTANILLEYYSVPADF